MGMAMSRVLTVSAAPAVASPLIACKPPWRSCELCSATGERAQDRARGPLTLVCQQQTGTAGERQGPNDVIVVNAALTTRAATARQSASDHCQSRMAVSWGQICRRRSTG